ncbi:MAG: hypothetical protein H8E39_01140 [Alphaproteobacteria bacterium]|nr:hypothetical protein [Alphaproteobacteria bacterium]
MAHLNKVLKSINTPDGGRCVDIFLRPDGTFGFEEFRRDAEDPSGWFAIGGHIAKTFDSEEAALDRARASVSWFGEAAGQP